jgi:predicted esterase
MLTIGPAVAEARAVALMLHGRGQSPDDLRPAAERFAAAGIRCVLPEADGNTWYPRGFMKPVAENQPAFAASLARLSELLDGMELLGVPPARIVLAGFSQGGCMTAELLARRGRRYRAGIVWTGGRLGPPGTVWPAAAGIAGVPVLVTGSDVDEYVPEARVRETADFFRAAGAAVELLITPGRPHEIGGAELARAVALARG